MSLWLNLLLFHGVYGHIAQPRSNSPALNLMLPTINGSLAVQPDGYAAIPI